MIRLQPSRLRDYGVCPMQYRLKHLERRTPLRRLLPTPSLSLGNSLHSALAEFHHPGRVGAITADDLLGRHWQRAGFADAREEANYKALARHVLGRYLLATPYHHGQVLGTELFLARVVVQGETRTELACRVDRLTVLPSGALEVLDYKSNRDGRLPDRDRLAYDLPTFVYYLLARVMYPEHPRVYVAQLNLLSLDKTTVDYTPDELTENKARLLDVVAAIETGALPAPVGPHCAWCPVRADCPAFAGEAPLAAV